MYAGLAKPIRQKFGTIWLRSTPVHWIRNACVVGGSTSCSWTTATIPGHIAAWCCKKCNVGIGHLGDQIEGIERALHYLKKANERRDNAIVEKAVGG